MSDNHTHISAAPQPALAPADSIPNLLSALPADLLQQFPDALACLKTNASVLQEMLASQQTERHFKSLIVSAVRHADLSNPKSLLELNEILSISSASIPRTRSEKAAKLEQHVKDYLTHTKSEQPIQAALPDIKGLDTLVEIFKEDATSGAQRYQKNFLAASDGLFAPRLAALSQQTRAFAAVFTWNKPDDVTNIWGDAGVPNQAANVLSALIADPKSSYAQNMCGDDLTPLVDKLKVHKLAADRQQTLSELASLPPQEFARAVEMFRNARSGGEETAPAAAPKTGSP